VFARPGATFPEADAYRDLPAQADAFSVCRANHGSGREADAFRDLRLR
jgi:hypothetical protein